jgi:uroporphyrinogen decarboxylase
MTDIECFNATVEHRRPGHVLFYATFTEDLYRRLREHTGTADLSGHYGFLRRFTLPMRRPENVPQPDLSRYYKDCNLPEGTRFQNYAARVPAGVYHFTGIISPLRNASSLSEVEEFPMDDMSGWDFSYMKPLADQAHADDRVVIGMVGCIYEAVWQIRGLEPFILDLYENPGWAQSLIDRQAEAARIKAVAATRAGADFLFCHDDVASQQAVMFPIELWRSMLLAPWRRIWAEVKSINPRVRIWYHSDGNVDAYVDDLVEAGVEILNPLQPECLDIVAVHRRHGNRITFDGAIGTQSTMPFGSPSDVRARVREVIDKYGRNGGLIVSPTHILEPEVPLANIDAFADACREFGTFE